MLLTPVRGWWLYLLMYYVIQVGQGLATGGREPQFVLVSNLADVVEPLIGALLIRRFALRPRHIFVQFRDVGIYVASVTVGSAVGATLGALNQVLHVNGGSLMP